MIAQSKINGKAIYLPINSENALCGRYTTNVESPIAVKIKNKEIVIGTDTYSAYDKHLRLCYEDRNAGQILPTAIDLICGLFVGDVTTLDTSLSEMRYNNIVKKDGYTFNSFTFSGSTLSNRLTFKVSETKSFLSICSTIHTQLITHTSDFPISEDIWADQILVYEKKPIEFEYKCEAAGLINKYTAFSDYSCFTAGTLITLADGSRKPIEEITYDDELKVWNFDKGCYDSAKPFWITKAGQTTEHYYRMTFSDGTVLNILGPQYKSGHKLYNYTDRKFEGVKTLEVGKEVYTENGVVTLVSKEEVNEEVEFYCLMTEDHLNCFAEGVLASLRYNNIYPFDENMKFIKDGRSRRPYKEFKAVGISREWYNGLRLGEQTDDLDTIKKYVDRYDAQTREKPAPTLWQRLKTWWKRVLE